MTFKAQPLFPGMLHDCASRLGRNRSMSAVSPDEDDITAMGWSGVLIPERFGGSGGTVADLAAIIDGLAPYGVLLPVIERCAIAPILLGAVEGNPENEQFLAHAASGDIRVAPLVGSTGDWTRKRVDASTSGEGFTLTGQVNGVDVTKGATHYLILSDMASGDDTRAALFLVAAQSLPAPLREYRTIDGFQTADFVLSGFAVPASACIAVGHPVESAIAQAESVAMLMTCVDCVSTIGALVEQTAEYLNNRVQFGVALSTFQALRHRLADVYIRYESSRGLVEQNLRITDPKLLANRRDLRLAKLCVGEASRFAAQSTIQLHGGMGVSEEMLAARLAKRLLTNEFRYGDRLRQAAMLSTKTMEVAA
jgi:alkylation response protein AidB-like acyl-CoA dehydrogenase